MPGFQLVPVDGLSLYRPSRAIERAFDEDLRAHLRGLGLPAGTYSGSDANRIAQAAYQFSSMVFENELRKLASRDAAQFVLEQLGQWTEAISRAHAGSLAAKDEAFIMEHVANMRLAAMYVLEAMVRVEPPQVVSAKEIPNRTDLLFSAVESMITASMYSTLAHGVAPDAVEVHLDIDSADNFLHLGQREPYRTRMDTFRDRRLRARQQYPHLIVPAEPRQVLDALDPVFSEALGFSLSQALGCLKMATESYRNVEPGFDVAFVLESKVYQGLAHNCGLDEEAVRRAMGGLVLTTELLTDHPRELWRPKRHARALRRPFLRLPHDLGPHLCWKNEFVLAAGEYILQELCFGQVPPEWQTQETTAAAKALSQSLDSAWEEQVYDELGQHLGLVGEKNVLKIADGSGGYLRMDSDDRPGELDGLFWDPSASVLLVVEVKRTRPSYSPPQYRDDVAKYISGDKSYTNKHAKKVAWVEANVDLVHSHLAGLGHAVPGADELAAVRGLVVTKYENFVQVLDTPHPVLSLAAVLEEHNSNGRIPYRSPPKT